MRATRSVPRKARKDKIMKLAKGFRGRKKHCYGLAIDMIRRKLKYQYRDRRKIKSNMRALWITRINAGARMLGTTYSKLIKTLSDRQVTINRKILADLAVRDFENFKKIVCG